MTNEELFNWCCKQNCNMFFNCDLCMYNKGRADAIEEFAKAFIEEGKKIKYLRHLWIESTCKKIAEQLKEQSNG